ncbi:hypothetical protein MLD38_031001 [Melastoma candidum]|uniref:Uncharacterized protein n=1 Tax=Melastoma candidum TaxID=119954 RepID=A0ACB9MND9_9MYRT|nr:hypothetical protein MLD38_031001 [Melastoma candidum]
MSSGTARGVSQQDIQLVQNLIEQCLQLYMNQKEVVETLLIKAKIEPGFTKLVWQKLEEENREFFEAYYLRLTVKHQITEFNKLLEQQVQLMHQMHPGSVPTLPNANGTRVSPLQLNSTCYATDLSGHGVGAENIHLPVGAPSVPGVFTNGGSALPATLQEISAHLNGIDSTSNMLHNQSMNMGLISGMNGGSMIKNEAGYPGGSYIFSAGVDALDARPAVGAPSVPSFSSVDSAPHPLNEPVFGVESGSYDLLGSIPRSFSLSDLTADFSQSSDILEYPRSPFLGPDADHFLESRDRGDQGDDRRLNLITENLSYSDFCSD